MSFCFAILTVENISTIDDSQVLRYHPLSLQAVVAHARLSSNLTENRRAQSKFDVLLLLQLPGQHEAVRNINISLIMSEQNPLSPQNNSAFF